MKQSLCQKAGRGVVLFFMFLLSSLIFLGRTEAHGRDIALLSAKNGAVRVTLNLFQSQWEKELASHESQMSKSQLKLWKTLNDAQDQAVWSRNYDESIPAIDRVIKAIANKAGVKDERDSQAFLDRATQGKLDTIDQKILICALSFRALCFYFVEKYENAEADYQASITISRGIGISDADLNELRVRLGDVWFAMGGRSNEMIKEMTAVINISKDARLITEAYVLRASVQDHDWAIADLGRAIAIDSDCFRAYQARAAYYETDGKFEAAIADLDQIIRILRSDLGFALPGTEPVDASLSRFKLKRNSLVKQLAGEMAEGFSMDFGEILARVAGDERDLKFPNAVFTLTLGLTMYPNNPLLLTARARINRRWRKFDEALADCDRVIKAAPHKIGSFDPVLEAIYQRGLIKLDKEDYNGALHDLGSTFSHNEEWSYERHKARGQALIGLGSMDHARSYLSQAIDSAHNQLALGKTDAFELSRLYFLRGGCFRDTTTKEQDFQKALQDFSKAIELDPECYEARESRTRLYYDLEEWQKAIDDASEVLKSYLSGNADILNVRAKCYQTIGDIPAAIKDYEAAIAIVPDSAGYTEEFLGNLAWLLATGPAAQYRNGQKAVQYAEKAVELTKGQVYDYLDTLAAAYAEAGRFKEAVATEEKAIAMEAHDSERDPAVSAEYRARLTLYKQGKPFHHK